MRVLAAVWFRSPVRSSSSAFCAQKATAVASASMSTILPIAPSNTGVSPSLHSALAVTLHHTLSRLICKRYLPVATAFSGEVARSLPTKSAKLSFPNNFVHNRSADGSTIFSGNPNESVLCSDSLIISGTALYSNTMSRERSDKNLNFMRSCSNRRTDRAEASVPPVLSMRCTVLRILSSVACPNDATCSSLSSFWEMSCKHSSNTGLNAPHSPFAIMRKAASCEKGGLYTRSLVSASYTSAMATTCAAMGMSSPFSPSG